MELQKVSAIAKEPLDEIRAFKRRQTSPLAARFYSGCDTIETAARIH